MRRLLLPLLLLPALVLPALAEGPAGATSGTGDRSGTAASPAAVRSVLKQTGDELKGRLTSSRDDCVQNRDVYLIVREDDRDYPYIETLTTTNGRGRWSFDLSTRRQGSVRLAALTLGGPRCEIAQSNQIPLDPARSGSTSRAGGLADVSITLEGNQLQSLRGKITSSRDVCHEYRPVFAFYREAGTHDTFANTLVSVSRKNGKYFYGEDGSDPRLRGVVAADVITVVPGTNNCRPAQSKPKTFTG